MNRAGKHSFPTVLLVFTLVLALLFTGFSWPGFLLPIFRSEGSGIPKSDKTGLSFTEGKSKAFSVQPTEGVTISAEENALDKKRDFKMDEVSPEKYQELAGSYSDIFTEPVSLMKVWELDAGLSDDEMLPGNYRIDVDLKALGIDEELYDDMRLYRIDDKGNWYEYSTGGTGSVLSAEANQNSILALVFCGIVGLGAVFKGIDLGIEYSTGAYIRSSGVNKYTMNIDGKNRFRLIIDTKAVKKLLFDESKKGKQVYDKAGDTAIRRALKEAIKESDIPKEEKEYAIYSMSELESVKDIGATVKEIFDAYLNEDGKRIEAVKNAAIKKLEKYYKEELEKDPAMRAHMQSVDDLALDKRYLEDLKDNMKQVEKVCGYLEKSYFFLKDVAKVKMPDYVMDIHLTDEKGSDAGQVQPLLLGNPYMILFLTSVSDDDQKEYDDLLLTMTHELFHACQRMYVSWMKCNLGFDETQAMMLEWDAFDYFYDNGTIKTETGHLENLKAIENFAVPLDDYITKYPEGEIGESAGSKKSLVAYPRAPFLRYLRGDSIEDDPSYDKVLSDYKSFWTSPSMTELLKKAFLKDEESLTESFYDFAVSYQTHFLDGASKDPVFGPVVDVTKKPNADIKLLNKSYTIRVRRIKAGKKSEAYRQYAMVIKKNDDFDRMMSDFKIVPMNLEEEKDYVEWKDGLFILPRDYPNNKVFIAANLMEVDGGTAKKTEGWFSDAYSGYKVCFLEPPEAETDLSGSKLIIQPMKPDENKKDFIDSVVVTATLGDERILFEQIPYKDWNKPAEFELKAGDRELSEDELLKVKYDIRECVTGTFDKSGEGTCLGPEAMIKTKEINIAGTWDADIIFSFGSKALDPAVDLYNKAVDQYGDMYGLDSISGLSGLGNMYKGMQQDQQSKATLIIKSKDVFGKDYEATFKYTTGAPDETYDGIFDASTMKLTLKPRDKNVTDSRGNSYNLGQYGLQADVNLQIKAQKDDSGKSVLTFTGESANDPNNSIVSYSLTMTGTKVSDKYE